MNQHEALMWARLEIACDSVVAALDALQVWSESPITDGAEQALLKMYRRLSEGLIPTEDIG